MSLVELGECIVGTAARSPFPSSITSNTLVRTTRRFAAARPSEFATTTVPTLTVNALREPCRFSLAATSYIEPGLAWQNPYVGRLAP